MSIIIHDGAICDTHVHTRKSDGTFEPREILTAAKGKLKTLIFADHDTARGYDENAVLHEWHKIDLIPGVELSAAEYKYYHILGYGMDKRAEMEAQLSARITSDELQMVRILKAMRDQFGVRLTDEFIDSIMVSGSPNRGEVASKLAKQGFMQDSRTAYDKMVEVSEKTGIHLLTPTMEDNMSLINRDGGITCWAHPKSTKCRDTHKRIWYNQKEFETVLASLVDSGLDAIEGNSPGLKAKDRDRMAWYAKNFGLLNLGGTDFHGDGNYNRNNYVGNPFIKQDTIEELKDRIHRRYKENEVIR